VKQALLDILRAPGSRVPLRLTPGAAANGDVQSGVLTADDGQSFEVRGGIPRFVTTDDAGQVQTRDAFGFKWAKVDTYDSAGSRQRVAQWLVERYGFATPDDWARHFNRFTRVLDVGCGSGLSSGAYLCAPAWSGAAMYVGADISTAVDVASHRLGAVANTHFVQADALDLPFADGTFDAAFSEGVMHHTPSTRAALFSAARVVASGGEIAFYVYRKKGAIREFTDDYVRDALRDLSDEQAWEVMRAFTRLGQALASLQATVDVPDIPLLGIAGGRQDVQRLVYWNFAKLYWNDQMSFEENVHVNFDWYRPVYAHRHTAEEVRSWCEEARIRILRFNEQDSGFTVVGTKQ
jgi:SAM-dependent methyltransferase